MSDFDATLTTPGLSASKAKRFEGTYKVVPKVDWTTLLANEFGSPDWEKMYPINDKGQPVGILSPRLACKLFHDSLFIIKKGEETPKYICDRIPEHAHKMYKKKQWRKQFYESMRRVSCRLASGLGFRPNCVAEDAFIHMVINMAQELGWRRIDEFIEGLPETDRDKDFAKLARLTNEDVGMMLRGMDATPATTKAKHATTTANTAAQAMDVKGWYKCYEPTKATMFDHIIALHPDDTENWSVVTGSSTGSSASGNGAGSPIKVQYRARGDGQSMSKISQISDGEAAAAVAAAGAAEGATDEPAASMASLAVKNLGSR